MNFIEVEGLRKSFRVPKKQEGLWGSVRSLVKREYVEKNAVQNVSFKIAKGEIVGLVGANGAGKTTLVKCLTGIIKPSQGHLRVLGFDPWKRDKNYRKQIALVMGQKSQLWWDLPANDCFELLKEIYQIPTAEYKETLEELVELLEVKKELNIQIRRLSLGERMKMELIASLLHRPKVLFLDEPTIGLDLNAQVAVRDFLTRYNERYEVTMILTSHYMEDIERLCRRIMIIREGSFVYDGELQTIRREFLHHKVISAHLLSAKSLPIPTHLGEVLSREDDLVRIRVPKDQVAAAASHFLGQSDLQDIAIEEDDIGVIISEIMRRGLR